MVCQGEDKDALAVFHFAHFRRRARSCAPWPETWGKGETAGEGMPALTFGSTIWCLRPQTRRILQGSMVRRGGSSHRAGDANGWPSMSSRGREIAETLRECCVLETAITSAGSIGELVGVPEAVPLLSCALACCSISLRAWAANRTPNEEADGGELRVGVVRARIS